MIADLVEMAKWFAHGGDEYEAHGPLGLPVVNGYDDREYCGGGGGRAYASEDDEEGVYREKRIYPHQLRSLTIMSHAADLPLDAKLAELVKYCKLGKIAFSREVWPSA